MNKELIGDNLPSAGDITRDELERLGLEYDSLKLEVSAIETDVAGLPAGITDEDSHNAYVAVIADARGLIKRVESTREAEKLPHLTRGRAVDAYFNQIKQDVTGIATKLNKVVTAFLEAQERARREEARREAERAEREAAEQRKREAEERQRAEDKRRREAAREQADREAEEARFQAQRAEREAEEAAAEAKAKASTLVSTKTDYGTSTLRTDWDFTIDNIEAIPLDVLRPFIAPQDIEKAVRRYVKAGHRELPGVRIYEVKKAALL